MYQNTAHITDVHTALIELLEAGASEIGVLKVYDDDVDKVDVTPSVGVQMLRTRRERNESGMMVTNQHTLYVLLYHAKITQQGKLTREANVLAEKVMDLINRRDPVTQGPNTLNGLVFNLFAGDSDAGTVRKGGARMRAVRITVTALSRTFV
jgi:hypothetical protein